VARRSALDQAGVKSLTEALRQFDGVLISQQPHHITRTVIHGLALPAAPQMQLNALAHSRREAAFHIVDQFFPEFAAIEIYELICRWHKRSRSVGCSMTAKVTFLFFVWLPFSSEMFAAA